VGEQPPAQVQAQAPFMLEAAGPDGDLGEGEAIGMIDRFTLQHRLPDGKIVLERFLASRPGLSAADREMLRGWRDPVEGIFEVRGKDRSPTRPAPTRHCLHKTRRSSSSKRPGPSSRRQLLHRPCQRSARTPSRHSLVARSGRGTDSPLIRFSFLSNYVMLVGEEGMR
jgi:hypothetical protein